MLILIGEYQMNNFHFPFSMEMQPKSASFHLVLIIFDLDVMRLPRLFFGPHYKLQDGYLHLDGNFQINIYTERIPSIDVVPISCAWKPILQAENISVAKLNGQSNSPSSQLKTNGTNCTSLDKSSWSSPLLKDSSALEHRNSDENCHKSNNNEWSQLTPSIKRDVKNGWKEIPQDEDGPPKLNGNGVTNGKHGVNGTNGHDKLAELDPLTGERKPNDLDELSNCGIGSCQPKWARVFSSTHIFMVVFLMAWILQGMYYTYFVSVITTIEKLFQIKSKTTGLLMSATEIGQIVTALFLTYYAGRGHRPRWIACGKDNISQINISKGMVLFAFSAFGCTLPHFIFGNQLLHANNAFYSPVNLGSTSVMQNSMHNSSTDATDSYMNLCTLNSNANGSTKEILAEQAAHSQITSAVLIIFFVSLLGVGVGQTAVSTLGIPYIDDNVASRESPIYIAITIGVRILGPAFGFILGSFCTRVYVDISDPGFGPSDPKWIGAWYLVDYVPDAVSGYCDGNCKSFLLFISLFSFFVFMHSTSEIKPWQWALYSLPSVYLVTFPVLLFTVL
ncbi:Solute carrier organic anion transporter family member 74D [Pseudolycoriella hygida]|uniref:Solute carrier organic anion transporter family member 74D n=1 Tax=Pseudolycoriella hygida TaxID=35572 RepID=A0A9Q0S2F6_9DIPT|nr:Solute carrier organic anion transporter family member 74D [Pseudolycoriella hygida]